MENYDSELDLPAFCNEPWGNIDMGGDNYFVDMYGIQWVQDEHNILFPEKDDNEKPDVLEVNTLVCMEEEDDVASQEDEYGFLPIKLFLVKKGF